MWIKKNGFLNKKIVINNSTISNIQYLYVNDNNEYLFSLNNGYYYICNSFPIINIRSNYITDINGPYQFLINSKSKEAIHYSAKTGYYAIPVSVYSNIIKWFFCKSDSFEGLLNKINTIDNFIAKGRIVLDVSNNVLEKTDQFFLNGTTDIVFYKTQPTNSFSKTIYYVNQSGALTSKQAPILNVFTDSVSFISSSSKNLSTIFTGAYGSRYVGWLWFIINGDLFYQKNVDINNDGEEWRLTYKNNEYYGEEPLRDSQLIYSTKDETPLQITVNYTSSKLNRFDPIYSISNSKEVTSV